MNKSHLLTYTSQCPTESFPLCDCSARRQQSFQLYTKIKRLLTHNPAAWLVRPPRRRCGQRGRWGKRVAAAWTEPQGRPGRRPRPRGALGWSGGNALPELQDGPTVTVPAQGRALRGRAAGWRARAGGGAGRHATPPVRPLAAGTGPAGRAGGNGHREPDRPDGASCIHLYELTTPLSAQTAEWHVHKDVCSRTAHKDSCSRP